jgi:hypothetical protein
MPATIVRALGYTGTRQVFTWPSSASYNNKITAYIWGGGGGGGGYDAYNVGGAGSGGGYSKVVFNCVPGDTIEVSVGSGGGTGTSSTNAANGGSPGLGLVLGGAIFNSAYDIGGAVRQWHPAYCTFLNNYGVWNEPGGYSANFNRDITVNFPTSGLYTFEMSVDNAGQVYLDGNVVLTIDGFQYTTTTTVFITAGNHLLQLRGQNYHGPGSYALTINGGQAFNAGRGGDAGSSGSSGGGGGGGGATVIRRNSTVIGVAGGGGGGGGAGIQSGTQPGNAPGPNGQSGSANNGSDGGDRYGDGGGGGGGGGGWYGGNGGQQAPYDTWGYAGYFGGNLGDLSENPSGRTPGGRSNPLFVGGNQGAGYGGLAGGGGNPGYAVLEFEINGTFLNSNGTYYPVKETWVKDGGIWKRSTGVYLKKDGVWQAVDGTLAPDFVSVGGAYGYSSRPNGA